jgi:hypothetical protein
MKRLIIAAALGVSGTALAEAGKPFEQTELDRMLPAISVTEPGPVQLAQVGGGSYHSAELPGTNPWANDHNFIAPAP